MEGLSAKKKKRVGGKSNFKYGPIFFLQTPRECQTGHKKVRAVPKLYKKRKRVKEVSEEVSA